MPGKKKKKKKKKHLNFNFKLSYLENKVKKILLSVDNRKTMSKIKSLWEVKIDNEDNYPYMTNHIYHY